MPTVGIGGHNESSSPGIAALVVMMAGSALLTKPPGRLPRMVAVEVVESQFADAPPYIDFDSNHWR